MSVELHLPNKRRHNGEVSETAQPTPVERSPERSPLLTTSVDAAAEALLGGAVVAFPTETVYGLGACTTIESAVARVFQIKARPRSHPLIVHLGSVTQLEQWARHFPAWAATLAEQLWPGPLTLVLPRTAHVSDSVTGGQDTVGLRVPDHPVALALLTAVATGVAAPSANRFGGVSATSAAHVVSELGRYLDSAHDLVLDGGTCPVGVESTIVLATGEQPRLLRPGAISELDITTITGLRVLPADGSVRAPGTLAAHYSPHASVVIAQADSVDRWQGDSTTGLIAEAGVPTPQGVHRLAQPTGLTEYAYALYAALRSADDLGLRTVVAVAPEGSDGLAVAIRDRLQRAAAE